MQQVNPSGRVGGPQQQYNIEEEKKKLEKDLKEGKISQAEYFKKMQELTAGAQNPMPGPLGAPFPPPGPNPPGIPQLPPAGMIPPMPGSAPIRPVAPVTPQVGPVEEVPPIGQALAVSSEDVEVVECYKCGGLITVTTKQRPVIIACPTCGTKGEVDASEPEQISKQPGAPKPTEAKEFDEKKVFKFGGEEEEQPKAPTFGSTLDEDLQKQDGPGGPAPAPGQTPTINKEKKEE